MNKQIILVSGSRSVKQQSTVSGILNQFKHLNFTHLMHGNCKTGVDQLANKWAIANNIQSLKRSADWNTYGKSAGPIRNHEMADEVNDKSKFEFCMLVAIWDQKSRGTKDMIDYWKLTYPQSLIKVFHVYKDNSSIKWAGRIPFF